MEPVRGVKTSHCFHAYTYNKRGRHLKDAVPLYYLLSAEAGEEVAGFLLLRVELSLLLAGLVALVDALPVFGTGTVLLPWAVLALLGGDVRMSVGLLVLYSVISLVRSLLEPRLVGARVGLPPLAALVCMYVGFQALGVLGMLLAPLAAVLARQLWDSGLLHSLFGP
mgnify:FL=1